MKFRTSILRGVILPVGDLFFGQEMIARLIFLEKAQWWRPEQVMAWQNQAMHRLVRVAYAEVPFYRDLMDQAGVSPGEIQTPADLSRLPIVTKDMLRSDYPHRTTRKTGQRTYEVSTSGSTGKNFHVQEDANTAGWYRASFMLALEWSGWSIGEPHLQTGITPNRSLDRKIKDWVLGCYYRSAYTLDDDHLNEILVEMERYHLDYLWGFPGSLYFLARHAIKTGWNRPLKAVVTWGDSLYPHYRKTIESGFQTRVYDTYGCSEGIQIAAQCEHGNYHLLSMDAVVEFVDDEGMPVSPGSVGNLVVTRLHPGPMPLIRYAIGDLGIKAVEDHCECGRAFPLLQSIEGRNADVITTPSGNRLIVHFFTGILEHFREIDTFQVVQMSPGRILVRLTQSMEITEHTKNEIITALKDRGAADLEISIQIVDEIAVPPSGKHRFIIKEY